MSIPGRTHKDSRGDWFVLSLVILDNRSEITRQLTVVSSVEGRKKFRIIRLPATKPVARCEKERLALRFGLKLGGERVETASVFNDIVEAQRDKVLRILGLYIRPTYSSVLLSTVRIVRRLTGNQRLM